MNEFNVFLLVIAVPVIIIVVIILFRLFTNMLTRRWNQHKAETVDKWHAEGVEFVRGPKGVQFGGLESMGINRVTRGVGLAVITAKDLRLTRSVPSEAWCITFKQIKGVAIQPAFMGKPSKNTPFIVVRFKKDGRADKLGFQVKDFEEWADDLAQAARVRLKDKRAN